MTVQRHAVHWFEIPVTDFERARRFYSTLFDFDMPERAMGPNRMGFFLHDRGGIGGAILEGPGYAPSEVGARVYLAAEPDLAPVLARVEPAGGAVLMPKTEVAPGLGFFALLRDTEGNVVALHSMA
jgi:predicted enzyme related to lactoylglutathione lyase